MTSYLPLLEGARYRASVADRDTRAELNCCGRARSLVAEYAYGRSIARETVVGRGIEIARWRCATCGSETYEGWVPPTWIGAVARAADRIHLTRRPVA
jgi:hypothetical protein